MKSYLELIERLGLIISRKERHRDYERVVEKAELYRKLMTGENMDSLMRRFDKREDDELFAQRKRITQHITKTVSQNVKDVYHKIPRSNSVQRVIAYSNNDADKLAEINDKLGKFWGKASLDDWMNARWIDLNFIDPNAFVVLEWGAFDNSSERATPYPYEVYSENAIMYEYIDNVLEYLVSLTYKEEWLFDKFMGWNIKRYEVYTIYGKNQSVQFVEVINEDEKKLVKAAFRGSKELFAEEYFRPNLHNEQYYRIIAFTPHNLGFVPAEQIGVLHDMATDGRTFVSPLDKGVPILMKMVKANSEFDLTMALHAFPQKIQYVSKCKEPDCRDGHRLDGTVCPVCKGSGFEVIKSAQEMINLALPKVKEDMLDLTNIVNYVYPPTDLVKFQKEYIDSLTYQVKESIFNTEIFSRQQVAETATGKNISLQNVYDALYLIAVGYSNDWEFLVKAVAKITDLDKDLIAFYKFSKDFKLKSLTDLYLDLKAVGDAKASEFIKSQIEDDIAGVIYSESERELQKYNVKKSWFPFNGKTPEQISTIVASIDLVPYETKVFWANFSYIFDMIELEQVDNGVDFFYLPRDRQWAIIQEKIKQITADVEKNKPKEAEYTPFEEVEETE
jgi:hypothetical protein